MELSKHPPVNGYAYCSEDYIPCKICKRPTPMLGTQLCNGCYEFDGNIDRILQTDSGRRYVAEKLVFHKALERIKRHCDNLIMGYQ